MGKELLNIQINKLMKVIFLKEKFTVLALIDTQMDLFIKEILEIKKDKVRES